MIPSLTAVSAAFIWRHGNSRGFRSCQIFIGFSRHRKKWRRRSWHFPLNYSWRVPLTSSTTTRTWMWTAVLRCTAYRIWGASLRRWQCLWWWRRFSRGFWTTQSGAGQRGCILTNAMCCLAVSTVQSIYSSCGKRSESRAASVPESARTCQICYRIISPLLCYPTVSLWCC